MKQDYTNYTTEDLLHDPFFIQSIQQPTEETDLFWKLQVEDGVIDEKEFKLATFYLKSIQVEHERISKKDLHTLWESIEQTNKSLLKKRIRRMYQVVAAACVILLVGFGGLFYHMTQHTPESYITEIAQSIKPDVPVTDTQLLITNKNPILISDEESQIKYDQAGELTVNDQIIDNAANLQQENASQEQKVVYSQLIVPNGKRATLTFSDGTFLWVNAGSRVIYPEKFDKKKREIYVDGEAFLQVSPDKDCPFIVKTKKMDIQVVGTSFNVMSYDEDDTHSVVLVEGEVKIKDENKQFTFLNPNQLYLYEEGVSEVTEVDVTNYISWTKGMYISKQEKVSSILDRLSRYYGKTIHYDTDIENITCTGKLDLREDLELLMGWLANTAPIGYKLEDGVYTVYAR